ncbi:MAG: flagellin [Candidatus Competibacteraceae bacterium]|nr:flagellin [Candidatus Competibacteraceae bacterium]MCP5125045.1 flagellin [Gammaproteobacteria bacterium]
MAIGINTNVPSLTAQRNLGMSANSMQTSMQRLSSGLRINSAKDDAAGQSIANRFTAQVRGLNQAARNANDGISLAQTAEGALGEITNNLQRLRELAVQSANATNSASDRASLQNEASQLLAEIDRVSTQTAFNGSKLLDGSFKAQTFQVGANANETIEIDVNGATTKQLGVSDAASVSSMQSANAIKEGDLVINGVVIGASVAAYDTASTANQSASAIAKAAAINLKSAETGVTATVDANIAEGAAMAAGTTNGTISINGIATATISTASDTTANRAATVKAINAISSQTGVIARDTGNDTTGVELIAADGRNIMVSYATGLTSAATGVHAGTNYGSFSLSSSKDIEIQRGSTTGLEANAGLQAGTYKTQVASISTTTNSGNAFAAGDFKVNGVLVGASLASSDTASTSGNATSAIAKAAAINAVSAQSGVTAVANANVVNGATMTASAAAGTFTINGVTTATIAVSGTDASAARQSVITAINAISGRTGVVATDDGTNGVKLTAQDGRNIVVNATGLTSLQTGVTGSGGASFQGTFTLSSAKAITVEAGTTDVQSAIGNTDLAVGTYGSTKVGESLEKLDISTFEGATAALASIDNAITSVDTNRSALGAVQNRFTSTIASLQITSENLQAARGRIQDADFAAETTNLSKSQVLQQAGIAMLSQANQTSQNVLSLLR